MRTNIAGEFQKSNLAAALQTAELICGRLDEDKIYEALSQIRISGRMEEIAPGIIVDVSHNIQGMQGFVQTVEANYHGMKKRILFAASHQNEEEYMKNILKTIPEIEAFYTVGIHKRRINEAEFQDAFRKMIDRNQETTVCFVVGSFLSGRHGQRVYKSGGREMLDFNEELAKFQPCADLEEAEENIYGKELEEIKKNKTELYKANQMIKKYNQALNYAKQGNDDLAMLQLKNVVAAIPNFVDAYLLMALLSIKGENYDNARTFLDTILKIDQTTNQQWNMAKNLRQK